MSGEHRIVYVDTSVVAKTLINEADSAAVVAWLDRARTQGDTILSSSIVITELRRVAARAGVDAATTGGVLARLSLVHVTDDLLAAASSVPGATLRSLDAIHIASAQLVSADVFATADRRQAAAARATGLAVVDGFE